MVFKEDAYLEVYPKQNIVPEVVKESMIENDDPGEKFKEPIEKTEPVKQPIINEEPAKTVESMITEEEVEEGGNNDV